MVNFGKAISGAWSYSTNLKRLAAITAFLVIGAAIVLAPIILAYKSVLLAGFSITSIVQSLLGFFVGLVIAILIFIYAILLFTHNYANQKSLSNSARFAKSNYLRFLGASIVVAFITLIVSFVPLIGFVLAIIVAVIFFFVQQEIAVSRRSISESLSGSYNTVRKNIVDVIVTLVITAVLSIIIVVIFAIPVIVLGMSSLYAVMAGQFGAVASVDLFVIAGLVLLVGIAFAMLFTNSIKTDVYMQIKKRKR